MQHDNLMLLPQKSRISTSSHTANTHIIKVWEDIGEPMDWADELDLINNASEFDTVVLDICSAGGFLDTAMLFNRALRSTNAHTVAIIGPEAASAASVFALSCKEWVLDETSSLMAHTSSYRIGGKDTDILEHANFSRKQLRSLYESVYTGFLTEDEIEDVIKGTPFYFDAQQLAERLDNLSAYRAEMEEQGCGHADCSECNQEQMPSLDNMIEDAVESGVQKALDKILKKYNLVKKEKVSQKHIFRLTENLPAWKAKVFYEVIGEEEQPDMSISYTVKNEVGSQWTFNTNDYDFYDKWEIPE